jgi:hypothetical protein
VQSLDEDEEGVSTALLSCSSVWCCAGEEAAHVVGVQLGCDPSQRVHERCAAIATQLALESDQTVGLVGLLSKAGQRFEEQLSGFALHKDSLIVMTARYVTPPTSPDDRRDEQERTPWAYALERLGES